MTIFKYFNTWMSKIFKQNFKVVNLMGLYNQKKNFFCLKKLKWMQIRSHE